MPKCLFLEVVLLQHTEESSWDAKNFFVLMEMTSMCVFQPIEKVGEKGKKG